MIYLENYGTIPAPFRLLHAVFPGFAESFAL